MSPPNRSAPVSVSTDRYRLLAASAYLIAGMMLALSLSDAVMRALPLRVGDTAWRIGVVGTVSANIATWLLALLVLCATAAFLRHRIVLRALAVLSLAAGAVSLLVTPFFVLDFLELRRAIRSDTLLPFDVTMLRATLAILATAAALVWIGVGSWRCSTVSRSGAPAPGAAASVMVSRPKVAAASTR